MLYAIAMGQPTKPSIEHLQYRYDTDIILTKYRNIRYRYDI